MGLTGPARTSRRRMLPASAWDHYNSLVSLLEAVASGVRVCMRVSEKCVRVGVCVYVCVRACGVCACACGV